MMEKAKNKKKTVSGVNVSEGKHADRDVPTLNGLDDTEGKKNE